MLDTNGIKYMCGEGLQRKSQAPFLFDFFDTKWVVFSLLAATITANGLLRIGSVVRLASQRNTAISECIPLGRYQHLTNVCVQTISFRFDKSAEDYTQM